MARPSVVSGVTHPSVLSLSLESMGYDRTPVLGRIELELGPGETVALTGPSGIGKSTLLRIVAGLETRFRGTLRAPERIGFVFQEPVLLPWRSALDNVGIAARVDPARARTALAEVGLSGFENRYPSALSLGQQRRLSLARAFALEPELLLLDEPFVSLDAELAGEMMHVFGELRARHRITTLIVTHLEAEADKLASRVLTLGGVPARIVAERAGSPQGPTLSATGR